MLGFMLSATQLDAMADHAISGQVVDSNGTPLAGVNVIIKDTNVGIVTDVNGKFTIRVRDDSKQVTFSFSFLGYTTIEKQVAVGITGFKVVLDDSSTMIDEVIAIGYGTQTE